MDYDYAIAKIVKKKDGWYVTNEEGTKNLGGPYNSREQAVDRLRQVEWFKNKGNK